MKDIYPVTGTFEEHLPWEYVRNTMRMAGLGFWQHTMGPDGRIVFRVNDNFLDMAGCDKDEFPLYFDEYLDQFIHPDDRAVAGRITRVALDKRDPKFDIEHRLLNRRTGQWRWVHAFGEKAPSDDDSGEIKVYGCIVDIDDARTAQEKLQASENALRMERQRLETVIEAADVLVWEWDLATDQIRYGQSRSLLGRVCRGEAGIDVGEHWSAIMSAEDRQKVTLAKERHCRGETELYEAEMQIRLPNGRVIWAQDRGRVAARDEFGYPARMMGVMMDVTRYKDTADALAESRRRLDQIIEAAEIATWDWDVPTDKLTVNSNYDRLLGLKPGEIGATMKEWSRLLHPDDLEWAYRDLNDMIAGRSDGRNIEMRMRHRDGHYVWAYGFSKVLEHDQDGQAIRVAGVQVDFTAKKQLEEAQAEALKVISRQKEELEKQLAERSVLLNEIQRQVEVMMNDPGNRQDGEQRQIREEMLRLKDELALGEDAAEGSFSSYMSNAFKFIANERVWYKAVLDSLPFPTSVFDLNRKWTYLNPSTARAMDTTVADLIGRHYRDGWKKYQDTDITFAEGEAGKRSFTRYLIDSNRFFSCQSSILMDENLRAIGFIETMQDVTDAHEADERVRLMLDATPLAVAFFDPDGELIVIRPPPSSAAFPPKISI